MKLRVLGCGTSSGVPRLGNDWGTCDPADPRNKRSRAAALLEVAGTRILIDCGPDMREQLNAAEIGEVDRVIITHDHADHLHGIDDLRQVAHNRGDQVPVFGRPELVNRIEERFRYLFHGNALYPAVARLEPIKEEWQLGEARLRFCDQPHGRITSLGMRIDEGGRSLAYAIDFHTMNRAMTSLYDRVDIWVADCLRRRPHPTHAHLDAVLGWARELRVGQLYLSHLDNSMDYAQLAAELPDWAAPAHDGLEIGW
ncbi:MBL fold metallo-hydrolase [Sphingomonas sp. BN140010]|uniref:MBL fold metallo-hydrolase n=1 Tax=Sphingomonas arvum TaxID=2992113 RepID=A0ABT3JEP8_9SPHN|nr:MBL fold metallo-hydrolase [Sphingomonas sp. BN140010]MCW3797489.1 MBL fold metallo-hydrolase [Sphingomonas sp. BN140010]